MASFQIRRNDTLPLLDATCSAGDPAVPVDVTGATVRFHMRDESDQLVVDAAGSVVDGPNGVVRYTWAPADTAVAGVFKGEFQITFPSTKIRTFPNPGAITITINADLG